jgi:NAD(P)-dependent dehydrogenase (short-subunit alcohol dehydrogenase family)
MRLEGKAAVVTGGATGIGRAIVERLAAEGAVVAIADVQADAAGELAAQLDRDGRRGLACPTDVTDEAAVGRLVEKTVAAFGSVDILVNNAVTAPSTSCLSMSMDDWDRDIAITLRAPLLALRAAAPHMVERGGGAVVNIASVNAVRFLGHDGYSAGKAGLLSLTRSAAVRLAAQGVRVNAVAPGTVHTLRWGKRLEADPTINDRVRTWYPMGRVGEPGDVAAAVAFLASDEAKWITGETLQVDGGLSLGYPAMVDDLNIEPKGRPLW